MRQPASYYARLLEAYWSEAETPRDLGRLLRIRLAQGPLGPLVCPAPTVARVALRSLGGDVWLRSHTTDVSVLGELVLGRSYLPVTRHLGAPPRSIVDLGANTGLAARWFLARYPEAMLVAVEPEPGNAAMLRRNLAPFGPRARVVQGCVGARRRRVALTTTSGEFGYRMTEPSWASGDEPLADVVTIDDLLDEHGLDEIDLLKCDIEGAEEELFADCSGWIDRVRLAVVECHGDGGVEELGRALAGTQLELVEHEPARGLANAVAILKRRSQRERRSR